MGRRGVALAGALLVLATGCRPKPVIEKVPDELYTPPSETATVTPSAGASTKPSATPRALRSEAPNQGCVNGWREPAQGTALRTKPLDMLRSLQGLSGTFTVVDLRYFTGPDDANLSADSKQSKPVERWYGKVIYTSSPAFKVRFIAVRREVGAGIVAVASYGTKDFASPDWYGFDGEGGKNTYPTVPGKWPGQPYDYVKAHELPDEVVGCLAE